MACFLVRRAAVFTAARIGCARRRRGKEEGDLERVKGIEPWYEAWEAAVLPLNYTRVASILRVFAAR